MNNYDVGIVGGGAAGLSAALVLSRARRSVVVIDAGRPRNAPAAAMHGFLSRDGLPPRELLALGRAEVASYGARLVAGTVQRATRGDEGFVLRLEDDATFVVRRLLVTTGLRDALPDVPGVAERWGRDLLHCPYCHGYEVRDRPLGVLGGDPGSVEHALLVRQWSPDVVLFTRGEWLDDHDRERLLARAVGNVEQPVQGLVVEHDRLAGVRLADGQVVPREAVFVRPGFVAHTALLRSLGAAERDGWPVTDGAGATSVPGLWVAGNAANPRAQVITAAGEGSAAAIALHHDLVTEEVAGAVQRFRDGLPV